MPSKGSWCNGSIGRLERSDLGPIPGDPISIKNRKVYKLAPLNKTIGWGGWYVHWPHEPDQVCSIHAAGIRRR